MKNKRKFSLKHTILALTLAFALAVEPSMVALAMGVQPEVVTKVVNEEETMVEETVTEAVTTEETIEEETASEEVTDEETQVEETYAEEVVSEEETVAEEKNDTVIFSESTAGDFTITDGVLTAYTGTATEITIPDGVTSIANGVFKNNTTIKKVVFPSSLLSVGDDAFNGCTDLREVQMNEGLKSIGSYAFNGAGFGGKDATQAIVYGTLTIPSTVNQVGHRAFRNCQYLKEVTFANGETLGLEYVYSYENHNMFENCVNLQKVTLPNRAKEIPNNAFINCEALKEVTLGSNVETIGDNAFKNCKLLQEIECPSTLKTIGEGAFAGCTTIKSVNLNEGLATIGAYAFDGAGFGGKDATQAIVYGTLTIPSTVSKIGHRAFRNCQYLKEVTFANGETLGLEYEYSYENHNVFESCVSLQKVILPDRAREIPNNAFIHCEALQEVTLGSNVETIGDNAFKNCKSLQKIECPSTLKTIGEGAFAGCTTIKSVKLNEGLMTIEAYAFDGAGFGGKDETQATVYGTLTIPSTVSQIGHRAFRNCQYLKEVTFVNGETLGQEYLYSYENHNMFESCVSLQNVILPDRAREIPNNAFINCEALQEVTLGSNVETIGDNAFKNCKSLQKIECPSTLKTIGEGAFAGCTTIKSVKLNEGLMTIGAYAFDGAGFGGKDVSQTTVYGTLTIPSTVSQIGHRAFRSCQYLKEVTFVNGETLGLEYLYSYENHNMFEGCASLKKVTLPDRAREIPNNAFINCEALEEVVIGKNVETIENSAFKNCKSLQNIECPSTLTTINEFAFDGCSALKSVTLNEGLGVIGNYAFRGAGFGGKNADKSITYGTLIIPSTVYSIGALAFSESPYLQEVNFLNGKIVALTFGNRYSDYHTFYGCKNLKKVYLPERLEILPAYVFSGCEGLDTIYIPKNVTQIDVNTFKNCNYNKLVIYGETGSAAETFAKENGIAFKHKSELPIYVKGIRLNRASITFAGEESIGKTVKLYATVLPDTALNKTVKYSSTNNSVATVDEKGVVTIVGYGEADIWAKSEENEAFEAKCHVTVLKKWTNAELDEIRTSIEANNNLTVVSNVYTNIQDLAITAPNGITAEWKLPYEVETGVHTYDVILRKAGYQDMVLSDVTVKGITVTGVTIQGPTTAQVGKNYPASVEIMTEGGELKPEDYQIEWRSANSLNVKVSQNGMNPLTADITGSKVSKGTNVYAKVILVRNGKAVSVEKTALGKTWFEPSFKVAVSQDAVVDDIVIRAVKGDEPVELGTLAELVNITGQETYTLQATAFAAGEEAANVGLTWKSSDEKVAKVKTDATGKTTLAVLGKGTSYITVTAAKNGGYTTSFKVTVKDSQPRLAEKTVTINRYLKNAVTAITLRPSDGYAIDNESLSVVDAKTGADTLFEVKAVDINCYEIGIKKGETVPKGKYKVNILVKTSAGEAESHKLPVTINVVQNAPKVTIKQTAINLYEEEGRGMVEIITDARIQNIQYTSKASLGNVRLVQDAVDTSNGVLYVKAENALATNYKNAAAKGVLEIAFEEYVDEANYNKNITLATNKKLPAITATAASATLYPETLADETTIVLYNKTKAEDVLAKNGYSISVNTLAGYQYYTQEEDSFPRIQALKGAKKGTLKYVVTNDAWIDGVKVNVNCGLKIGKVPTLSFATNKVVLNNAYNTALYNPVTVDAYVKGFENIEYNDAKLQVVGKDAKSKTILNDGALDIYMEDGKIKAGISDNSYFKKAGNYTFIVTAYSTENMPVQGVLKVNVVLAKSKASISLKAKGTINLLDRENTSVIATPTVKNYTGTVKSVELYGANAGKFTATVDAGKIVIKARKGKAIMANKAYTLGVSSTLDSGVILNSQIKVTPKQKSPKLTQSKKSVVLFETAKGQLYGEAITIQVAPNQVGKIKSIKQISNTDAFGYQSVIGETGILYVKDTASLKTGKKYTVNLAVSFEEEGSNAKPTIVKVTIEYRK